MVDLKAKKSRENRIEKRMQAAYEKEMAVVEALHNHRGAILEKRNVLDVGVGFGN